MPSTPEEGRRHPDPLADLDFLRPPAEVAAKPFPAVARPHLTRHLLDCLVWECAREEHANPVARERQFLAESSRVSLPGCRPLFPRAGRG